MTDNNAFQQCDTCGQYTLSAIVREGGVVRCFACAHPELVPPPPRDGQHPMTNTDCKALIEFVTRIAQMGGGTTSTEDGEILDNLITEAQGLVDVPDDRPADLDAVATRLNAMFPNGIVTVEYPGCIEVQFGESVYVAGKSNATWGADYYETLQRYIDGLVPDGGVETTVPVASTNAEAIAQALAEAIRQHA